MFDVFYLDRPTGLFPHERHARDVQHAQSQCSTRYCWIVNYLCDYTGFDFLWEPPPWQAHQTHVWPSQHQRHSGTMLVPRRGSEDVNRAHDTVPIVGMVPRVHIRHCANSEPQGGINARYVSDYLGTLRRVLAKVDWQRCWVTSDVCNYDGFDFTWHPSEWHQDMLHVFASDEQKFGDTFYVDVPTFLQKSENLALLEWFETLHFVEDIKVPRYPVPVVQHDHDTSVTAVAEHQFNDPVVLFSKTTYSGPTPAMNLWRTEMKKIAPLTTSASVVLVPRDAKTHMRTQLYDYPYITREHEHMHADPTLDVVFVSNGEANAEINLQHLRDALPSHMTLHVVRDVQGRVASQHAAALASHTSWYFLVPAKLKIDPDFDWTWQPDLLQAAKHYIFHAYNPVTELEYGHQAMVAYNRDLVLDTKGSSLDFTMERLHEVVPIRSGTVNIGNDKITAWRSAFREVIKLHASLPDTDSAWRLDRWLDITGEDAVCIWSRLGARDGLEFAKSREDLMLCYDWQWCRDFFNSRYSTLS